MTCVGELPPAKPMARECRGGSTGETVGAGPVKPRRPLILFFVRPGLCIEQPEKLILHFRHIAIRIYRGQTWALGFW